MTEGFRKRQTYDEVAQIVENNADIIKKYPDRRAIAMRNHPYLTILDGESFLNAMNFTQEHMIKGQQRELLMRTYAAQSVDMSHLEFIAKTEQQRSPTRVETFDMTVDDGNMSKEDKIFQHFEETRRKASVKKKIIKQQIRENLKKLTSSSAAASIMEVDDGNNPESTHEPKGPPGRPLGSARPSPYSRDNAGSSSAAAGSSSTAAPVASSTPAAAANETETGKRIVKKSSVKAERVLKMDDNKDVGYWKTNPWSIYISS